MGNNMNNSHIPRKHNIIYMIDGLGMGGAERLMIPILRNLDRNYFEPRVCVFQVRDGNPVADDLRSLGVPVDLFNVDYLRDITALPRLIKYLKKHRADLVHTQLEFANTLGNIAAKLLRLPSVCTIHTLPSQDMSVKSKAHQDVEMAVLRFFCDQVISVSEEARQYHLSFSKATPQSVSTIYNGIELAHFADIDRARERQILLDQFQVPNDAKAITTVAVLREPKGIQFMIQAMPAILEVHPDTYYFIAGDGAHKDALVEEVEKMGVGQRVIFAGMRKDVPQILSACDLFVLPTLTEALPTVLAEAMAAGLPIVASAVGGVPEMVSDGENGILVSPANPAELSSACIGLLSDAEKCAALAENGLRIVHEKFNIQTQVEKLKNLYLDFMSRYGR